MDDKELIKLSEELRIALEKAIHEKRMNTTAYAQAYHRWFELRTEGVARKIYDYFIPTKNDPV